jgi:L-fuculose-phosphate aldolase
MSTTHDRDDRSADERVRRAPPGVARVSDARLSARRDVIDHARRLVAERLVHATAGNLSVRVPGEPGVIAMTPTAAPYDGLAPDDICIVTTAGEQLAGTGAPTSERPLHTLLYARRPEVGAIIHTHSPAAMTLAVLGWRLPAILTGLVEAVGGDVRVTPYTRPGTEAMVDVAQTALRDRGACLLGHHGLIAIGADLPRAFRAASVTEATARVYLDARAHATAVPSLSEDEVGAIAAAWRAQWAIVPGAAPIP